MQTRKTIIAAALVWMAGLLGIILFQNVFAGSLLGAVLGILMVIVTLAATYFMVDGMLMLKQQSEEQQDLLQRAYQDKLLELMSQEMERLNDKKANLPLSTMLLSNSTKNPSTKLRCRPPNLL